MLQTGVVGKRIAACLVAVAGFAVAGNAVASEHNVYIPADTPFYMGTGEGMPIKHMMAFQPTGAFPSTDDMDDDVREMLDSLSEVVGNLDKVLPEWGLEESVHFSTYSVGIYPVMRVKVDNPEKFNASLTALEKEHDLKPASLEREGFSIRYYGEGSLPQKPADGEQSGDDNTESDNADNNVEQGTGTQQESNADTAPGVIVATNDDDLIITLVSDTKDAALVDRVLGITKPSKSIEQSGKLKELRKRWGYGELYAAFFDFEVITDILTTDSSAAIKDIEALAKDKQDQLAMLQVMRSEPCRSEIKSISDNWPQLVMGARQFDVDGDQLSYVSHAAAEVRHEKLLETLQLMRGVMPASQSPEQPMFSMGLGISVDRLTQVIGQMTSIIASLSYECPLLNKLNEASQADLSAASMGMVMFGGLARGVEGISLNIFDLDIDTSGSSDPIKGVDTAVTITAVDPALLVQTLQMMPQLAMLAELPLDGTEISLNSMLPVPMPPGVEFKAAVKENNIVLFSGGKAADFISRLGSNNEPGFFRTMVDTRKIIDKVTSVMDMLGQDSDEVDAAMKYMESYPKGTIEYGVDFTGNGIELEATAVVAVPE
jgi:hypothetical protein